MSESDENAGNHLTLLGSAVESPASPEEARLEKIENECKNRSFVVRFTAPEFTCLCPKTGQPDFAHFIIDYIPGKWLVESKSLKLYLHSFRNYGSFHETTSLRIASDLEGLLDPVWLRLGGYWYPRGGLPIDIFYASGKAPENIWIPEQAVASYRGRG